MIRLKSPQVAEPVGFWVFIWRLREFMNATLAIRVALTFWLEKNWTQ
jgi:hypothetical protein